MGKVFLVIGERFTIEIGVKKWRDLDDGFNQCGAFEKPIK